MGRCGAQGARRDERLPGCGTQTVTELTAGCPEACLEETNRNEVSCEVVMGFGQTAVWLSAPV